MKALLLFALLAAAAPPADVLDERQSAELDFSYGWSAAAEAIPALRRTLMGDRDSDYADAMAAVAEMKAAARENGFEFHGHYFHQLWQSAGGTNRLLSLFARTETFTGGAHGNVGFDALLWDRAGDEAATVADVLGGATLAGMEERYCSALDALRAEKRGEPVRRDPNDPFTICPELTEQALVPADTDSNGRFDTLRVLIAPYEAGPYAEGTYELEIALTPADLAGIEAAYRASFEASSK